MNRFLLMVVCLLPITVYGQETIYLNSLPVPEGVYAPQNPPKIKWTLFETENFTILSVDKSQGEFLVKNIEKMKEWTLDRWGLPDVKFSNKCVVYVAPDKDTMKTLFNLEGSFGEGRYKDGKLEGCYLWLVLEGNPTQIIPAALTGVVLKQLEAKENIKVNWAFERGMAVLNLSLPQIKANINELQPHIKSDANVVTAEGLLKLSEEDWKKLSVEQKTLFDRQSVVLCLLIRKQFGQRIFQKSMATVFSDPNALKSTLGFDDFGKLNSTYALYMMYLAGDIAANKTPDNYLQITKVE